MLVSELFVVYIKTNVFILFNDALSTFLMVMLVSELFLFETTNKSQWLIDRVP